MSFFERRYHIKGWYEEHCLTAKALWESVMEDASKSDYNWIASATELVKVCNAPEFPKGYAQDIKVAILNCFASLEFKKDIPSHGEPTDQEAVYYCYNSLSGIDGKVVSAKTNYLLAIIKYIAFHHFGVLDTHYHSGPTYFKIREEWVKKKLFENISKNEIDFRQLIQELHNDFDKTIKTAEEEGAFKKDDEEHEEEMRKFWSSLHLGDI